VIHYFVGLDLGQSNDYSACAILEQELKLPQYMPMATSRSIIKGPFVHPPEPITPSVIDNTYLLRYLKRFELGTPYPLIVEKVYELMQEPELARYGRLIVDKTGVGAPVVDMFKAKKLRSIAIVITGGHQVVKVQGSSEYHVPKADIVSALAILFHSKRLKISGKLEEAKTLRKEIGDFSYKISRTGHASYGAEGAGENDDLVLSVALPSWYALRGSYTRLTVPGHCVEESDEKANDWNPLGG